MNIEDYIIDHFYPKGDNDALRELLLVHSRCVAEAALEVCREHPELGADEEVVRTGAMLHDIGIVRCDAPSIHCFGSEPYIKHGPIGAEMLEEYRKGCSLSNALNKNQDCRPDDVFLKKMERICARHTGTGLPGLEPETTEEKIVCYADKFFSKTRPERRKTYYEALRSLEKFGQPGVEIFKGWHKQFGPKA